MAWLIISTPCAVKGDQSPGVPSFQATAQFPWSIHLVFGGDGRDPDRGYRAVIFVALPIPRRGTPPAKS
jgi:hypothetical protein